MSDVSTCKFIDVCASDDVWIGEMLTFDVGQRAVLVMNVQGELYAYDNVCPHQSVPLDEGSFEDGVLTCRAHQWTFDARSGCSINPSAERLTKHPIRIENNRVWLGDSPLDT
jgi:nitrite reductase/ring-hydroxylating ferredoxin subunit